MEPLYWCPHYQTLSVHLHEADPITGTPIPCGPAYYRREDVDALRAEVERWKAKWVEDTDALEAERDEARAELAANTPRTDKPTNLDRLDDAIFALVEEHGWTREQVEKVVRQALDLVTTQEDR